MTYFSSHKAKHNPIVFFNAMPATLSSRAIGRTKEQKKEIETFAKLQNIVIPVNTLEGTSTGIQK